MGNSMKYYIKTVCWVVILLFTSGGIIQTFFMNMGMSADRIGIYTAAVNIMQIVTMILSFFLADNIKRVRAIDALLSLAPLLITLSMLPFCFVEKVDKDLLFYIAMGSCIAENIFVGIKNIVTYRLPYLIFDMDKYAYYENNAQMISGIVSIAAGLVITVTSKVFDFKLVMAAGFVITSLLSIFSALVIYCMKEQNKFEEKTVENILPKLKRKDYAYFYIPNLIRGFSNGIMGMIAVIYAKNITKDTASVSGLVTVLSVSLVVGPAVYQMLRIKFKTDFIYFLGGLMMFVFLPLMLAGKSATVFYIFYFLTGIGFNIVAVAGAIHAAETFSYEDIGSFTSIRLIIFMAGTAIASYAVGKVVETMPSLAILIICGVCQMVSGIMYMAYRKQKSNRNARYVN